MAQFPEIDARSDELAKCVNCGLCQAVCPTYLIDGYEGKTARGKIELMRGLLDGSLKPSTAIADLADDCLTCYACRTVCPAGVETDRLWTAMRQDLAPFATNTKRKRRALHWSVGSPRIMRLAVRRYGKLHGFDRKRPSEAKLTRFGLPLFSGAPYLESLESEYPAFGEEIGRIGLLIGCSGNLSTPWAVDAAISLLRTSGWRVIVPKSQGCCGAPAINNGQWKLARKLARKTLDVFEEAGVDRITSPDATCSATLSHDYLNLFAALPADLERVEELSKKRVELGNILGEALDDGRLKFHPLKVAVTVHDSCHSFHLGGGGRWRDLLTAIPGLEIREMRQPSLCCGFGGSYSAMHREGSDRIAARKIADAVSTGAELILVSSPGCQIRLQSVSTGDVEPPQVRYVAELLAGMAD